MVVQKEPEHRRVASVAGVPSAIPPSTTIRSAPTANIIETPPKPLKPTLKRVRITNERGDLTRSGYIYKAMTNLGEKASQINYNVVQRGPRGEELILKVTNKQTTPEGEISGTVPELVYPTVPAKIQDSKNLMVYDRPVSVPKVYIKWEEQQIGEDTYTKGRSPGYFAPPRALPKPLPPVPPQVTPTVKPAVTPKPQKPPKEWYFDDGTLRCKELSPDEPISKSAHRFANRRECNIALMKHKEDTRKITPERPVKIVRPAKRKVSARVEEIMKKRSFPKAVKEAIEKGLEQKDAPRDIERIIEKVAKTNEPDYVLRRTIAKRMSGRGIVQYKVDTDKGTIIYENADEQDANAILGMETPTGEVIPLQIKVIR